MMTVKEVKTVLLHLDMHQGPINDVADDAFRREIEEFQKKRSIALDGYMGSPLTYTKLREVWPEYFKK